ncbi:MAG: adenylyl-sulfate kinase [Bacteroidales bacterium]|nr:adenylyl-sulfate kinase [Bacteroidales bacterium]
MISQLDIKHRKEKLLRQHAVVIWMCGLSGSGKSTLAAALENKLLEHNYLCQVLDGDNIRNGLNRDLSFSDNDRKENLRRIAEVSGLFVSAGVITINAFISPTKDARISAREIIGKDKFLEVYINAPLEVCEKRDTKGLYKKARTGEIPMFTGISSVFEPPLSPDIEIRTNELSVDESLDKLFQFVLPYIEYKN